MSKTIVNLALSAIVEEAETILDTYPSHPYQQAFSIPDMRQKLISYVMNRIPTHYAVVDELELSTFDAKPLYHLVEAKLQIETLIHQGIEHILQEDSDWIDRHIPQETNPTLAPSNWFG